MKHFFILGRNPRLSKQEIESYLIARKVSFKELFFVDNFFVIETEFKFNIGEFGGIISLGIIEYEGNLKELSKYLESTDLIYGEKFNYTVSGNIEPDILKHFFKINKQKATLKHGRTRLKFQDGTYDSVRKGEYNFFLYNHNRKIYYGKVLQTFDSKSIEFRDMNKPVRREELAISPRLSKILINLSGAKEGDLILDPFCGVGGILIEALLKNINVVGSDKDKKVIVDCRKNLDWLKRNFDIKSRYFVENRDVKSLTGEYDSVVTESPLGLIVKKKLNAKESKEYIEKFENFIIMALKHIKQVKKKGAKIVIIFPFIRNNKVNKEKVCAETGLKLSIEPIEEFKPNQIVCREIVILE